MLIFIKSELSHHLLPRLLSFLTNPAAQAQQILFSVFFWERSISPSTAGFGECHTHQLFVFSGAWISSFTLQQEEAVSVWLNHGRLKGWNGLWRLFSPNTNGQGPQWEVRMIIPLRSTSHLLFPNWKLHNILIFIAFLCPIKHRWGYTTFHLFLILQQW